MCKKTENILIRVTKEQKEEIQTKSNKLGFKSMTAFLTSSAEDFFIIEMDLSHFRELSKEINYIGKNINNLVHHIFTIGTYSNYDLKEIQRLQKELIKKVNIEYDYLLNLRKKYTGSNMSVKDKKKLIEGLKKHDIEVPKELYLKEIYENIRENILYICTTIESSPNQEDGLSEYVYEYLFDGILFELEEEMLIDFSNEIFIFSEKIKMKLTNVMNVFDDDDWYELKDILDKFEDF